MPRRRRIARPTPDQIAALQSPIDAFLRKMLSASEAALTTSKCGYTVSGHQKYVGEMQYHSNCISCIKWLLCHTQSWSRNRLTWDTDTNDG